MRTQLLKLGAVFAMLGILAVGGGTAVLPEMQHATVHWFNLTDKQFRDIYSLGQVAPGPNMLMVLVIGYRLMGALGAAVVGIAFFIPDCALTLLANRLWVHFAGSPWRLTVQRGMAPVAIGLMCAGTYAIGRLTLVSAVTGRINPLSIAITIGVGAILLWRHVNPGILVLLSGTVYMLLSR
ncbi:MAG TPA: chromate transporter [Candidatus Binataceae bacterium]|nr:chromate transporter [Candidatus Binataceae bacterium]